MRKHIKTLFGVLTMGMVWMLPAITVLAGNINSEERRVVEAAKGPFTYEGKQYVPTDATMERLENYLKQDDVDMTKEQADEAIRMGQASVADGVAQGYLVPTESEQQPGQPSQPEQPSQPSQPTQPTQPTQPSQPSQSTASVEASTETVEATAESVETKESETPEETVESTESSVEASTEKTVETSAEEVVEEEAPREVWDGKFEKGLNILTIALLLAALVVVVAVIVVVRHKNRFSK